MNDVSYETFRKAFIATGFVTNGQAADLAYIAIKQVNAHHKKVMKAAGRFATASVAYSHKGGGYPEDIPEIEYELAIARRMLTDLLS